MTWGPWTPPSRTPGMVLHDSLQGYDQIACPHSTFSMSIFLGMSCHWSRRLAINSLSEPGRRLRKQTSGRQAYAYVLRGTRAGEKWCSYHISYQRSALAHFFGRQKSPSRPQNSCVKTRTSTRPNSSSTISHHCAALPRANMSQSRTQQVQAHHA